MTNVRDGLRKERGRFALSEVRFKMEINITQQEAIQIVGCLKICSKMDSGVEKLDKIADRITRVHIEELKKEVKNG